MALVFEVWLTSCVTSGKSFNLSVLQFCIYEMEVIMCSLSWCCLVISLRTCYCEYRNFRTCKVLFLSYLTFFDAHTLVTHSLSIHTAVTHGLPWYCVPHEPTSIWKPWFSQESDGSWVVRLKAQPGLSEGRGLKLLDPGSMTGAQFPCAEPHGSPSA